MNEDTHLKLKQLAEQLKRQQPQWQTIPSKKGKKVAETCGTKVEASTEAKGVPTRTVQQVPTGATGGQVPTRTIGGQVSTGTSATVSTETSSLQALVPTGATRTLQSPIQVQTTTQRRIIKPYATAVVKNWYNQELRISDESTYSKLNGCFRALQSNNKKSANYWLTQLEKSFIQLQDQFKQLQDKERQIIDIVQCLCLYSTTVRSEALSRREEGFYTGTSKDQQELRKIFSELDIADMLSVRIQDFCHLLELCGIKNGKQRQLDAKLTIQKMITLNQQNLIEDGQLVAFFRNLEATDISALFNKSDYT